MHAKIFAQIVGITGRSDWRTVGGIGQFVAALQTRYRYRKGTVMWPMLSSAPR